MKIGLLYPRISHYREEFFEELLKHHKIDFYVYETLKKSEKNNFQNSYIESTHLKTYEFLKKVRIVNVLPMLRKKYDVFILIGEIRSLSVWLLLGIAKFKKVKTVLWGHGISIHSFLEESKRLKLSRRVFHKLADLNWFYTQNEVSLWRKHIPNDKLVALNNTINIEEILETDFTKNKELLKEKYNIKTEINFIFSARFSNPYRRADLIPELIKRLDKTRYGFIIIGDGDLKPDFSLFDNVYDFGAVYDRDLKNELFTVADLYYQPAWTGLSVNEALAYGKMVLTFERSMDIKQSVEFAYLNDDNSYIASDMDDLVDFITHLDRELIEQFSQKAKEYAKENLTMNTMVHNAVYTLNALEQHKN